MVCHGKGVGLNGVVADRQEEGWALRLAAMGQLYRQKPWGGSVMTGMIGS